MCIHNLLWGGGGLKGLKIYQFEINVSLIQDILSFTYFGNGCNLSVYVVGVMLELSQLQPVSVVIVFHHNLKPIRLKSV